VLICLRTLEMVGAEKGGQGDHLVQNLRVVRYESIRKREYISSRCWNSNKGDRSIE
jgi:hypothetical protein